MWRSNTVAREAGRAKMRICPTVPSRPCAERSNTTGWMASPCSSSSTVWEMLFQATTPARSKGAPATGTMAPPSDRDKIPPTKASWAPTPTALPSKETATGPPSRRSASKDFKRVSGVKRQASSRPLGRGKSARFVEVKRSGPGAVASCLVGKDTSVISPPILPSVAQ